MQINKIISLLLIIFLLCSCKVDNNEDVPPIDEDVNESIYIEPITKTDAVEELGDDIRKKLTNYFGDPSDAFIGESLNLYGKTLDIFDLKAVDLYGNEVDFSKYKDSKVLIEIAATYCTHCGEQLKYISRIKDNLGDIDIIQIFADKSGNAESIYSFYANNNHKISDDAIIVQYNYDLVDKVVSTGISQTPTFMFVDSGVIKTALSSFNSKFLESICKVGFTDTIKREEIVDKNGKPLEKFFRTYHTLLDELDEESKEYLDSLHESNSNLIANNAGNYFNLNDLTNDYDDGYIKKDSFNEYDNKDTIIFGLSRDNEQDLNRDISIINDFLDNNKDINGLIVFLDDVEYFLYNTSEIYLASDIKANCPVVSSRAKVPYQINDIAFTYIYEGNVPMILFVENNYITGMCVGTTSLISLDTLKDMFFNENCITLKENLNRNY